MAKYKENPLKGKDYYLYEIPELTRTVDAGFSLNAFDIKVTDTYMKLVNVEETGWNGVIKLDEVGGNYYITEENEYGSTNRFLASVSGTTYTQSAFTVVSLNGNLFPQGNVPLEFTKTLIKTKTTQYDLTKLNLSEGTYNISVIAKADGYKASAASAGVSYTVAPPKLAPATIALDGDTLNIYDESGNATSATIYVDGVAKETVEVAKGYNVTIGFGKSSGVPSAMEAGYSLDNGQTWNNITASINLENITQIKFRGKGNGYDYYVTQIYYEPGVEFIINTYNTSYTYSDNIILTEDKTITVWFANFD